MPLEDEDFLRDSRLAVLEKTFVSVMDGSVFFSVFFSDRLVSLPAKIYRENLKQIKQALTLTYLMDSSIKFGWCVIHGL